ncbi:MAG TPA: ShlB/FhaC/HecB family hemolysin secretion/activation protein [Burkholderiales bacterium]|nr:ShlB/FhaC/HecB family hemolysin secretion/activation protein [Burkholderiales bacterium]
MRILFTPLVAILATTASAQVVIPPGLEPGQIQRGLKELRLPERNALQVAPAAPVQVAPPNTADLKFVLREIHIDGATVYPPAELAATFARSVGQEISVAQVFQFANELTARYRRDGYVLSQVLVPAQDVAAGRVNLLAVEGYVDAIQLRGAVAADDKLLTAYGADLKRTRPLTAAALERYLLLINDLASVSGRGTLVPSATTQGAADLVVDVTREYTTVSVASNNRSSKSLGSKRANLDFGSYGLIGEWDHVGLHAGSSLDDKLNFVGVDYGATLGARGLQWTVGATGVRARPGRAANLTTADLETQSVAAQLELRAPLLRSRAQNLYLRAAFTTFDGQSEFSSADLSNDAIRALRLGATYDLADRARGITTVDLEVAHGFDAIGARTEGTAESPLSRAGGRADFTKATLYLARLQSLGSAWGGSWSALTAVTAQHAFDTLLAPELFAFGGDSFGRGYDASELAGDSGEAFKLELRYAGVLPDVGLQGYSVYGFYDVGRVRRRDALNERASEHASAAGLGLRMTGRRWQGLVEYALPLDHDVAAEGNRSARFFFGVQVGM